jgi:hypothetical protein
LSLRDVGALIGITSMVNGELMLGQLDPELERHLRERLTRDGLMGPGRTEDLVVALEDLAQRLSTPWATTTSRRPPRRRRGQAVNRRRAGRALAL